MNTLIIRPGAIGDFILSLPALHHLLNSTSEIWCSSACVPLARLLCPARSIQSSGLNDVGILDTERAIRALGRFDRIYSWYGANRPEFRDAVAHLPFQFFAALPDGSSHASDFYCAQVGAAASNPRIEVPAVQRDRRVVLHPFASSPAKRWPMSSFCICAEKVAQVEWCAGPEDPELPRATRMDDLYDLACHLATAAAYVGNDSGITHLAAAVGTPTVAVFGPSDSAVWAPRGPHVRVLSHMPLEELPYDSVLSALQSLI